MSFFMSKKIKIFIPVIKFYPEYAGWISQSISLFKNLPEIYFYVYTNQSGLNSKTEEIEPNILIERVKNPFKSIKLLKKIFFFFSSVLKITLIRNEISTAYFPFSYFPAEPLILFCKFLKIKTVCRLSGGELGEKEKFMTTKLRLMAFRQATHVIVLNLTQKTYLTSKGFLDNQIKYIPNSINLSLFEEEQSVENLKKSEGLGKSKITIGFVGYLTARKGLDRLIQAINQIEESIKINVQLLVVGPDEAVKGEELYHKKVMKLINNANFNIILTGRVSDVSKYYKLMDIYVLPSRYEGMPNALLEAMAFGVPSIGSKIPGIWEVIGDNENGLIFEPEDISMLSNHLRTLVSEPNIRLDYKKRAIKKIDKDHNLNVNSKIYKKILSN